LAENKSRLEWKNDCHSQEANSTVAAEI